MLGEVDVVCCSLSHLCVLCAGGERKRTRCEEETQGSTAHSEWRQNEKGGRQRSRLCGRSRAFYSITEVTNHRQGADGELTQRVHLQNRREIAEKRYRPLRKVERELEG